MTRPDDVPEDVWENEAALTFRAHLLTVVVTIWMLCLGYCLFDQPAVFPHVPREEAIRNGGK